MDSEFMLQQIQEHSLTHLRITMKPLLSIREKIFSEDF